MALRAAAPAPGKAGTNDAFLSSSPSNTLLLCGGLARRAARERPRNRVLAAKAGTPAGVDAARKEAHLSSADFAAQFGMARVVRTSLFSFKIHL